MLGGPLAYNVRDPACRVLTALQALDYLMVLYET